MPYRYFCASAAVLLATAVFADSEIDFARDVRPILSDACFHCHGPDEDSREAGLRLDLADDVMGVIEPGDAEGSELLVRLIESDPELQMPPPESGKSLTPEQIATLKAWVLQGAPYEDHWAFVKPTRPDLPSITGGDWARNPIDHFVLSRLLKEKVDPSPEADSNTLIRRLSLDLTGLPPEPEFVQRWSSRFADEGEIAYQQLVAELLQSSHFGERWARLWLDAARYADSDGYEKDKPRTAWFYRDWVIRSFNEDRPYNDFVLRQIAGDLLPDATQEDRVATGFLRNSMVNEEGGADPEQFRMEAMFDRMDAVGKAVLGLTVQCSQCHSHKYDPLKQEEYYAMFACLNNTHDAIISVYTPTEQIERQRALEKIEQAESEIKRHIPDWKQKLIAWTESVAKDSVPEWQTPELDLLDTALAGSKFLRQSDGSYLCQSYAPTSFKPQMTGRFDGERLTGMQLDLLSHPNLPRGGPGRSVDGTWALSEISAEVALSGNPSNKTKLRIKRAAADRSPDVADLKPRYDNKKKDKRVTGGVDFAIDGDEKTAWTNEVDSPRSNVPNRAWFEFAAPFEIPDGQHAIVTVYLAQRHGGWNSDDNQTFNVGRYRLSLTADPIPERNPLPLPVADLIQKPRDQWSDGDWATAFSHWRTTVAEAKQWNDQIAKAWESHPMGTTQLSLSERDRSRETWLLGRGDFLTRERLVQPGGPDFLHPMPQNDEPARLRFARWIVSDDSPTTARSIVNRIWQAYFGTGLVETSDDLGTQSAPPSHPRLLDYLAVELMENGWSLKHLHRLIVTSATYRQSSKRSPELAKRDPYNRLLARGARFRVPAETVRDIALTASGLLDQSVGGRSVFPPAPSFLFTPPVSYGPKTWSEETDSQRYRRALYTFRFRSVLYPMLENFDAVACNVSCVRRNTSNTPMQALTALNEPLFMESSVALSRMILRENPKDADEDNVSQIIWRCLSRAPSEEETQVLLSYLNDQRQRIKAGTLQPDQILESAGGVDLGDLPRDEVAAWTLVSRVVLNLDETITRE